MSIELNTVALLFIAILNAITGYFAWQARQDTLQTRQDIGLLEKNTNSIRDALVATTAQASEAKGRAEEKAVGDEKAAILARGQSEGKAAATTTAGPVVNIKQPLPVADDRTAVAAERSATATERVASAAEDNVVKKS